jgi:glutathione S-transferase
MILRSAPPSPFGRKVKIAASLLGLTDRIEIVAADTNAGDATLNQQNPLGKIPTLVLEDGSCLYDSRVICEYLDSLGGGTLFPAAPARWDALRRMALGDGIAEAALLQVYEKRVRPEAMWHAGWLERQQSKVDRAVAALEASPPGVDGGLDIGHVGIACALGYLDLRFEGRWRSAHPRLVAWLDAFAVAVPAYEATRVKT